MEYNHKTLIVDGKPVKEIITVPENKIVIYEVLRIVNGIPLFVEKHLIRLNNSASLLNKKLPFSDSEFKQLIEKLISENNVFLGNIKISVFYSESETSVKCIIGFIPHSYPTQDDYKFGVKTISSTQQRINPGAKVQNSKLRGELNKFIDKEKAYEAVLVHPEGYITEGSRSNLFFIIKNKILTAPDHQVLSGITRENVIDLCRVNGYDLEFSSIYYRDLKSVDAAFITGTSPKVLPIRLIDTFEFRLPNPIISGLTEKYDKLIADYLKMHLNAKNLS